MITITGANGKLGRLVAQALGDRGSPSRVRLGTRDPGKLGDLAGKGFKTVAASFDQPESLVAAFDGAETVLIISGDGPNDARIRQHRAAVDAAKKAGVGRLVYTSFTNATPKSLFTFAAIHADTEAYLKASGVPFTILRNNQYAENVTTQAAKDTGALALPGVCGKVAHISRADIAAATAAALTGEGHAGKTYDLTGPEALDLLQVAAILSQTLKKTVTVFDLAPSDYAKVLAQRGLPPFVVEALVGLRQATGAGEYADVTDHAARLAGRPIEPLSSYLSRQ